MRQTLAALFAALLSFCIVDSAACAPAQAAVPFPEVPLHQEPRTSHLLAYSTLLAGGALIGVSFTFEHQADDEYDRYLAETDVNRIPSLYDRTLRYDRLSSATLIGGEAMLATGLYLRFLRRPGSSRFSLVPGPSRCSVAWRF